MKCSQCGAEISEQSVGCPVCQKEGTVTILSKSERDNFTGETIETSVVSADDRKRDSYYKHTQYDSPRRSQRMYKFNFVPATFWGKAAAILLAGLLVFVAVPLLFAAILVGALVSMFFFRRR